MEDISYVELIEEAKQTVALVETSPSTSSTERLVAASLSNVIKAFENYVLTPRSYGQL